MNFEVFSLPALVLVTLTSFILLAGRDWRLRVAALALQYFGVFLLVATRWPADLAAVKLVAGWMAGSVLGVSRLNLGVPPDAPPAWPTERVFRVLAATLVLLTVASLAPLLAEWVSSVGVYQAWASLLLIGMGLLNIGLTTRAFPVVLSLLTMLSGFEILYAAIETSTLVAGLLALVNLGIALAGSYLMTAETIEATA